MKYNLERLWVDNLYKYSSLLENDIVSLCKDTELSNSQHTSLKKIGVVQLYCVSICTVDWSSCHKNEQAKVHNNYLLQCWSVPFFLLLKLKFDPASFLLPHW